MAHLSTPSSRGQWGSGFVFILAAAGSAIGLGNIWRFPMSVADGGGGAFLLIYLACIFAVGLPVMLAEMVIGRAGEKNPVGAMKHLKPGTPWYLIGALGVITGVIIISFYSVIAGWAGLYFVEALRGSFVNELEDAGAFFGGIISDTGSVLVAHFIFMAVTSVIVAFGIRHGIELMVKIAMPLFFILLLVLIFRAITLPGSAEGLAFYLKPDWSTVNAGTFLGALGQAFFSLSLGMGAIITYGSYLQKKENLPTSSGSVVGLDTLIAILAGLIIFPALFSVLSLSQVEETGGGPGLIFIALPNIFHALPMSWLFSVLFFALLLVAALTSAVSLLEVGCSYFVDEKKWSRPKVALGIGVFAFLLGIPSALSLVEGNFFSTLGGLGISFLDLAADIYMDFALLLGGLGIALFVGWGWGLKNALAEIRHSTPTFILQNTWCFMIRYIAPIAIIIILLYNIYSLFTGD